MTFTPDMLVGFVAFGVVGVVVLVYLLRTLARGRARHARSDADGGSPLLHKGVMELAYWVVEPIVGVLAAARVTPAQVTVFSLVPAALSGACVALGWFALAALVGGLGALCDLADGLLARRLGVASDAGEALDAAVDRATEFLFLAGVAVYYRTNVKCLLLALFALFGGFMVSYTTAKAEAMSVAAPRGAMRRPERSVYLLFGAGLTAFTQALWGGSVSLVLREFPIIFALTLVATVTNVSSVQRLGAVIELLRARDATAKTTAKAPAPLGAGPSGLAR